LSGAGGAAFEAGLSGRRARRAALALYRGMASKRQGLEVNGIFFTGTGLAVARMAA